jgi:pimeloyl-ACP methyl ester carboxylesterase
VSRAIPRRAGFLERDGERLYYEDAGQGEPLVLCHGMGGNHAVWFQQVACFAASRRVISFDHRGFGRSSDRGGRSGPEVAVQDLAALLDELEIAKTDLVGQSMGGWTALGFALSRPAAVRRLVLADTLGGIELAPVAEVASPARRPSLEPPAWLGRHPALDDAFGARDPARAHLYQMLGGFGDPDLAAILPRLVGCRRKREELAALTLPVLFVVGERDPLFPPEVVHRAAAMLPAARMVEIAGTGHSPYFEDPGAWNAAVAAFLSEPGPA